MGESIGYARTAEEETAIEATLESAAISYSISLDAVPEAFEGTACSLVRVYSVDPQDASRARARLETRGLAERVIGRPMCPACGHPENPHRMCGYGDPPTDGWMECPVEGCQCKRTWSLAPELRDEVLELRARREPKE